MHEWLLVGAPIGCQDFCTDSGQINREMLWQWLQFFIEQIGPISARKVPLVLDIMNLVSTLRLWNMP
jgi:hypothetical protein